jgi:hypothetical protein
MADDKVRVGDRYVDLSDRKITITKVEDGVIEYSLLVSETGAAWATRTTVPLPYEWTKVGSGPEVVLMCVLHPLREREPGLIYCPECVDQGAGQWSKFSLDEAQDMAARLLKDAEEKR